MTPEHPFIIAHQLPASDTLDNTQNSFADTVELATIEYQDVKDYAVMQDALEAAPVTSFITAPPTEPVLTHRSISVVLPAWNEEEIIAETVQNVVAALQMMTSDFEVIVVDDG